MIVTDVEAFPLGAAVPNSTLSLNYSLAERDRKTPDICTPAAVLSRVPIWGLHAYQLGLIAERYPEYSKPRSVFPLHSYFILSLS